MLLTLLACAACAQTGGTTWEYERHGKEWRVPQPQGDSASLVYVALGDSTGVGLGARNGGGYVERLFAKMRRAHPEARLFNLSAVNATTTDVLHKQMPRATGVHPTIITVCIGANDVMAGVDEESFARAYQDITASAKKTGATVVVMTIPNIAAAPAMAAFRHSDVASRAEKFNRRIEDAAARDDLLLVDLYRADGKNVETTLNFFSSDGLHPSDEGYAFWAEIAWSKIEQTIREKR